MIACYATVSVPVTATLDGHRTPPLILGMLVVVARLRTLALYVNGTEPVYRQLLPRTTDSAETVIVPPVFLLFQEPPTRVAQWADRRRLCSSRRQPT